eukprot:Skav226353  [mRNA]  locus=scaffold2980:326912:328060:- [translate_table: standard]
MAAAKMTKSPVGQLMAEIVAEFFEFYQFSHTLSVFLPESNLGKERRSRAEVALDAGLIRVHSETSILEQLMSLISSSSHKMGEGWNSSASSTTNSSPPPQLAASMASTRHSAWETGNDTPPAAGQVRSHGNVEGGERTREFGGGAAVVDALSSAVAGHDVHKGAPEEKKEEVLKTEEKKEEAPHEEVRERRQRTTAPRGKLPALSTATSPLSSGKELLPPLRGVGLGNSLGSSASGSVVSGIHTPEEEVSLGEQSAGALSEPLDEVDRQLARLNRPTVGRVGLAAAASVPKKKSDGPEAAGAGDSASDGSGSGDIELTGNRVSAGNGSSGSSLAGGPVRALPSEGSGHDDAEEVDESIEEVYSGEMEAYSEGSGGGGYTDDF